MTPEAAQRIALARSRLKAGGRSELRRMIAEGFMGRGGDAGDHVVIGLASAGRGSTEEQAIEDWIRDAGEQLLGWHEMKVGEQLEFEL